MHPTQTLLGLIAALVAIAQVIPYVISILRGNTRPQRASYGIWSVIQTIGITSYIAAGATSTKWAPIVLTINSLVIFGLSLKHGMGGFNKLDIVCLGLAAAAIALWVTTDNPDLAVYMSTLAGLIAYIPTIKKAYIWPKTENTLSWCMYIVAALLNVLALTSTKLVIALPLIMSLILSVTVSSLLLFPKWKLGKFKRLSRLPRPQEV
jgi:hypothetical protein